MRNVVMVEQCTGHRAILATGHHNVNPARIVHKVGMLGVNVQLVMMVYTIMDITIHITTRVIITIMYRRIIVIMTITIIII